MLLADAIVKVLGDDEFTKQLQNASEYKALCLSISELIKKPAFLSETFGKPSHSATLVSSFTPNINVGSNAIAAILYISRDRLGVSDMKNLGSVLSELYL